MTGLDESTRRKIIASARLLESDKAGERQAAAEALVRLCMGRVSIADALDRALPVAANEDPDWKQTARQLLAIPLALSTKERAFLRNLATARYRPTERQLNWLDDIASRLGVEP